ncbi:exonuclease subunit SbcD [Vibrio sp. SCSIO 43137]|uniref:exonuclease subunit SbcD n=1 Tax=Vibrio sp. SCSIO 43137 TaxID=3021011 RepID=UPI0023074C98|nr:exonuclease subunit SbcD [Vibrio sp. SCSIO 43137]WCE32270.1 exonuclease subunit SbcD [Vibrio sp. SCSIO 43137]
MRILHTSDWHLGQNFFNKSRRKEHQQFIDWLLLQVEKQQIDAVIIAGDIFDSGTPPSYAREMYNQFVVDISQRGCELVILGGNHDSVATLNESKPLVSCLNAHVIANTSDELDEQIICLKKRNGDVGALLCAVPFVRARDVMKSSAGSSGTEKQKQLGDAIKSHYHSLYSRAEELRQQLDKELPIIATGHLTAMGVTKADSERDIYIGTLDGFAADGFPPADYIALGHIHRPQIVAKQPNIRYCGSPIPLSFDELKSTKQVVMVDFKPQNQPEITPIDVPMFQKMESLKGSLEQIEQQLSAYQHLEQDKSVWLAIEVEIQDFLSDLQQKIQTLTEPLNVEVLQLRRARGQAQKSLKREQQETLSELTPYEVFEKRLSQESFETDDEKQRLSRIRTRFNQLVSGLDDKEQV